MKKVDWIKFRDWLENQDYTHHTVIDRFNYAKRFAHCLSEENMSELKTVSDGVRTHAMKALSTLSKFLGRHDRFLELKKQYDLKWSGKSADDLIIDRLMNVKNPNEVFDWIREVKRVRPELTDFMDLIALSGMRLVEAVKSYNLIIRLSNEGDVDRYYDRNKECLEHYKFKDQFLRKTKKAFISFVPDDLIKRISEHESLTVNAVQKRLQRGDVRSRFSDVRELHASYLVKYLSSAEIDFLHGRVSASVFMRNYFNPEFVDDLKTRLWKAVKDIKQKIS